MKKILFLFIINSAFASCFLIGRKTALDYYNAGKKEMSERNSPEAIKNYTRAIKMNPDFYSAYYDRAVCWISADSIERALQDYDSLLSMKNILQEQIGEVYCLKGNAFYILSQDSAACAQWRKARDMNYYEGWNKIRKFCK